MADLQQIPNFEFTGFYYFDILRDLTRFLRLQVPELTDESDEEPFEQLKRAWALAHHFMNVRLDIVANETLLPTARLLESVRSQLKLIDFRLTEATPGQAEIVMQFSSLFTTSTLIVPINSQFATEETEDTPQIIFEAVQNNTISRTDQLTKVFTNQSVDITLSNKNVATFDFVSAIVPQEGDIIIQGSNQVIVAEVFDSNTLRVNDGTNIVNGAALIVGNNFSSDKSGEAITPALTFTFNGAEPRPGDTLYLIHDSVMWDQIDVEITQLFRTGIKGVWEFFDGTSEDANPNDVINLGPNLRFDLTDLLGTVDRSGTVVRLTLAQTSTTEEVVSKFVAGVNIAESTGLLGQISPSTTSTDYTVGSVWSPLILTADGTFDSGAFSQNGEITYTLPQDLKQNWSKTTINGQEGFPLRFRVQELLKEAATFLGNGFVAAGLDTSNYLIKVKIDAFPSTTIDVTGDLGVGGSYTIAQVIANINSTLALVHASLSSVASEEDGEIRFTAPNAALGKDSLVRFDAPASNDALNEIVGLSEAGYPHIFNGVGGTPVIDQVKMDGGAQYLKFAVVQGETQVEDPLGSSDGSPNQQFQLTHQPLIDGTLVIEVDEGAGFTAYDRVDNFLNSDGTTKAYLLDITADDVATITFGDGTNGKIPPPGVDNIRATYRIGADVSGNVGARTITVNLAGTSFVDQVYNPRAASGWAPKQGSTDESLAKLKIEGPASLRTLGKAITPLDIETLANAFISPSTGSKLLTRSKSIEETFGVKTIELITVGIDGALLNQTQRTELEEYFNGNLDTGIDGVLVTNHQVTAVNYTQRVIDVTATVIGGNAESIKNALRGLINPGAVFDDNVTFRWDFGGEVPRSIIIAEIHETDPTIVKKVILTQPAADVVLAARELPVLGTISITVI